MHPLLAAMSKGWPGGKYIPVILIVISFMAGRSFDLLLSGPRFGPSLMSNRALEDAFLISVQVQRVHEVHAGEKRENVTRTGLALTNEAAPRERIRSGNWTGSEPIDAATPTTLRHLLFGIGSSVHSFSSRKELVRTWWAPNKTRGFVWLDGALDNYDWEAEGLPEPRVSEDTSHLPYTGWGPRSCLRVARIVVEAYRLGLPDVRWFVLGDDDTVFNPDALAAVLSSYDHTEMLYLGSFSETVDQLVIAGYEMAYGGGGIAVSWPLALALADTMDDCIRRYPEQYGSDARVRICSAELGVQLTRVRGFHQFDLRGNVQGFLQAHPLAPFISMHHVMLLDPVFPDMDRIKALTRFTGNMREDPINFLQTAFCIDHENMFTAVVSWGYSVKLFVGAGRVGDLERAETTFRSYGYRGSAKEFTFDTRPEVDVYPDGGQCATPINLWVDGVRPGAGNIMNSTYSRKVPKNQTDCVPHMVARVSEAIVTREVVPFSPSRDGFFRGPNLRRQCCRSLSVDPSWSKLVIELGSCNGIL